VDYCPNKDTYVEKFHLDHVTEVVNVGCKRVAEFVVFLSLNLRWSFVDTSNREI